MFYRLMPPQPSYLRSAESAQKEEKISEESKVKRERWTARQAEVLVNKTSTKVGKQSMLSFQRKHSNIAR